MRQIGRDVVQALKERRSFRKGNTEVARADIYTDVYLFGNRIARYFDTGDFEINLQTLREWPTPTTASRLNDILRGLQRNDYVSVRRGGPFINNIRI